jgi:hypothetical protein
LEFRVWSIEFGVKMLEFGGRRQRGKVAKWQRELTVDCVISKEIPIPRERLRNLYR